MEQPRSFGPLQRLDARAKIVGFIGFTLIVVSTPARAVWAFCLYAGILVFLMGISRVSVGYLLKRALIVVPFVLLVAVFLPFFNRAGSGGYSLGGAHVDADGLLVLWNVTAKALLGVMSMILLTSTTTFPEMLAGFQRLRVPQVFVLIVSFMYRYSYVFVSELQRMQRAMASRNYGARWLWNVPTLGKVLSSLFMRSYNRGERIHVAMISRGYEGTIDLTLATKFGLVEAVFLALFIVATLAIRVLVAV